MKITPVAELTLDELVNTIQHLNRQYRLGTPVVSDETYDHVYLARLEELAPSHPFLNQIEPEVINAGVKHSSPMLSTDKVWDATEVQKFVSRVEEAAADCGLQSSEILFEVQAKLDGIAGVLENQTLATRGDGEKGNDISSLLSLGLSVPTELASREVGELVINQEYFEASLADKYDCARNTISGLVSANTLRPEMAAALESGAVHFVPFSKLPSIILKGEDLIQNLDAHCDQVEQESPYGTDGAVISVLNPEIRNAMGANNRFHRWQVAKKRVGETAVTTVESITYSVGRTGRVTPVINVEPVRLSDSNIHIRTLLNILRLLRPRI